MLDPRASFATSARRHVITIAAVLTAALAAAGPAHADRGSLAITVGDSPDPAPTEGQVAYSIAVKNTGTIRAENVTVTVPIPAGTPPRGTRGTASARRLPPAPTSTTAPSKTTASGSACRGHPTPSPATRVS